MCAYSKNNTTIQNRKKIIRDTIACTNCGSKRHTYKQCSEPVTSWGMILVKYGDMNKPHHTTHVDLSDSEIKETQSRVLIESNTDRMIVSAAYHNIQFLMISRKNSVGYVEFIRGRYRPEKIDQVIYLFKQMMQSEIDKIKNSLANEKGFEYLWKDFWGSKSDSPYLAKDKSTSRANYDMLKVKGVEGPEIDLMYIVSTVKADYDIEEWGFPKGRKNRVETEEECAIREFEEESGYSDEDFKVIKNIAPLVEEFNGTNGIRYRHIYYVAELISNKLPRNNVTESQKDEIGNIQFMGFTTALECIRDYHIPRKMLLEKLFTYYLDKLVLVNRSHRDESVSENSNEQVFVSNNSNVVDETSMIDNIDNHLCSMVNSLGSQKQDDTVSSIQKIENICQVMDMVTNCTDLSIDRKLANNEPIIIVTKKKEQDVKSTQTTNDQVSDRK